MNRQGQKCRQIAGDFDCHADAAVRCGAHCLIEHIPEFLCWKNTSAPSIMTSEFSAKLAVYPTNLDLNKQSMTIQNTKYKGHIVLCNLVSPISHLDTIFTIYSCILSHELGLAMSCLKAKICDRRNNYEFPPRCRILSPFMNKSLRLWPSAPYFSFINRSLIL